MTPEERQKIVDAIPSDITETIIYSLQVSFADILDANKKLQKIVLDLKKHDEQIDYFKLMQLIAHNTTSWAKGLEAGFLTDADSIYNALETEIPEQNNE